MFRERCNCFCEKHVQGICFRLVSCLVCRKLVALDSSVFIVVGLCEVGLWDESSGNLSVCVGSLYTVVRSSLLLRLTKLSRKGKFSIFFDLFGKLEVRVLFV